MGKKKIFVVSDVHGYYSLLKEALDNAGFEPENEEHLLVCCGDYFDRGTENYNVLKYMERLKHKVLLRGNHEDLLLEIFDRGSIMINNKTNGTVQTLIEFFGKYAIDEWGTIDFSGKTSMLNRVTEFIQETKNYFETKNYVFTHGWLPTKVIPNGERIDENWREASEDSWEEARWTRWDEKYETCNRIEGKTIVCGHVPSFFATAYDEKREPEDASIFYGNGLIVVDAGTYNSGKINVLILEDELI